MRRFPTTAIAGPGGALPLGLRRACWPRSGAALIEAARRGAVESVAVDAWGVDYGLLDAAGSRLGPVHAYRSSRTDGVMDEVVGRVGRERIYGITGIQFLPFNTLYQLVAGARDAPSTRAAARLLMVPDLVNHALCGSTTNDVTNASTTQLLDVSTRTWSDELVAALGLRRDLLPALHEPGTGSAPSGLDARRRPAGRRRGQPRHGQRRRRHPARATGSTDVYISCGTWALVGCELAAPVTTAAALAANVTNELGVDGTVRLLKNVTGLWLLEECRRWWAAHGEPATAPRARGRGGARARRAQRRRSRRPAVRRAGRHAGADRRGVRRVRPARAGVAGRDHPRDPRLAGPGLAGDGGDDRAR